MAVLDELSSAASQVVAQVGQSVVRIGRGGGRGCGVVLSPGVVATNAHNLRGDETSVTFFGGGGGGGRSRGCPFWGGGGRSAPGPPPMPTALPPSPTWTRPPPRRSCGPMPRPP